MADTEAAAFRARYAAIEARLEGATAATDRDDIKGDIISLFKQVEAEVAQLGALREDIKKLVEKWKQVQQSSAPSIAPEFGGDRPVVVADHIGASTFVEKGWSLISLGDHEGAEKGDRQTRDREAVHAAG